MKNNRVLSSVATFTALTVFHSAPAMAAVPNGDQQVSLNGESGNPTVYQSVHNLSAPLFVNQSGLSSGSAATNPSGTPSVSATVHAGVDTNVVDTNVSARAGLDYWLQVNGPAFNGTIPIIYASTLQVNAFGVGNGNEGSSATAEFALQSYSTNPDGSPFQNLTNQQWSIDALSNFNNAQGYKASNIGGTFQLGFGNILTAAIITDVVAQDGGQASAFADPYFHIDPTFAADHPGYTLSLSPFAGNDAPSAGVPEPATWALLMIGIGAAGGALRGSRRRRTQPAHA